MVAEVQFGYTTRDGGTVAKKDLPAVVSELEAIESRYGRVTPKLVVAAARRNEHSVLRRYIDFEHVEESAAKWWLEQARQVIRSVYVFVIDEPKMEPTRAWVSVSDVSTNKRRLDFSYCKVTTALADDRYKEQLLHAAVAEIDAWKLKYEVLIKYSKLIASLNGAIIRSLKKHRKE